MPTSACCGRAVPPASAPLTSPAPADRAPQASTDPPHAADRLRDVPQYLRLYLEGCLCRTGIFGCCPCSLVLTEHCGVAGSGAAHGLMLALDAGLAGLGLGFALAIGRTARAGLQQQAQVARELDREARLLYDLERRVAAAPVAARADGPPAELGLARRGLAQRMRGLAHSQAQQRFNLAVPCALQAVASLAVLAHHAAQLLDPGGAATQLGRNVAGCLVSAYAGCFALAAASDTWQAPAASQAIHDPYARAQEQLRRARNRFHGASTLAWTSLAVLSGLQAGQATSPGGLVGLVTLVSAAAAMLLNSLTRWRPHTPVGVDLDDPTLRDPRRQRALYGALTAQSEAYARAWWSLRRDWSWRERQLQALERQAMPQCGPFAQLQSARLVTQSPARIAALPAILLPLLQACCREQLRYLASRVDDRALQLSVPRGETQALTALLAETRAYAQVCSARRQALSALQDRLRALHESSLAAPAALAPNGHARRAWDAARLDFVRIFGLLNDLVPPTFQRAHPEMFSTGASFGANRHVGSLQLAPRQEANFLRRFAPQMDLAFARAALNPHRLEAAIEYLLGTLAVDAEMPAPEPVRQAGCCGQRP